MNLWKLRRLAPRAKRVLDRHKDRQAALQAYLLTLLPAADAFMDTYDRLRTLTATRGQELAQGKAAVATVVDKMASWAAQLGAIGAIEDFDPRDFGDNPAVPDDVLSDADALVDIVQTQLETEPESIPFGQALIDDMVPAVESAKQEWVEATGLKSDHQELVNQNRENARVLSGLLVAFRRSIARVLGRNHPDYQTLRATKIDREVLEDGEADDLPPHLIPHAEGDADAESIAGAG